MGTSIVTAPPGSAPRRHVESPTERLDRLLHASTAPFTGSLSPVSLALAWADWAWHLGVSPGRQMELGARATQLGLDTLRFAAGQADDHHAGAADDDPRFRHEDWTQWPFNLWRHASATRKPSGATRRACPA
jgi:polyhydroxyalkanoate synthase